MSWSWVFRVSVSNCCFIIFSCCSSSVCTKLNLSFIFLLALAFFSSAWFAFLSWSFFVFFGEGLRFGCFFWAVGVHFWFWRVLGLNAGSCDFIWISDFLSFLLLFVDVRIDGTARCWVDFWGGSGQVDFWWRRRYVFGIGGWDSVYCGDLKFFYFWLSRS